MPGAWQVCDGKVEILTGFLFVFVLALLAHSQLQIMSFRTTSRYIEDALAASNLASAVMDSAAYGRGEGIVISPEKAYFVYREAIRSNLSLNDEWKSENSQLISSPVDILEYRVYNLSHGDVLMTRYGQDGTETERLEGGKGQVFTPDGCLVESACVYSRIGFWVEGPWGIRVYACKDKTVDIVAETKEYNEKEHDEKEHDEKESEKNG